jgi:hypothetical protein
LPPRLARIVIAFVDALLPFDARTPLAAWAAAVPERINCTVDPERFDDPILRRGIPGVFSILQWAPLIFFWILWKPMPFTWLSRSDRERLLAGLERSRIYGARGLVMVAKMYAFMFMFSDEGPWPVIGYDGRGLLPPDLVPTPAYDQARRP